MGGREVVVVGMEGVGIIEDEPTEYGQGIMGVR
jgi:hypothetical protein